MFKCTECEKTFKTKYNLQRHKNNVHELENTMSESEKDDESDVQSESGASDSDLESDSERVSEETIDPWYDIINYSFNEYQSKFDALVSELLSDDDTMTKEMARKQAYKELLPKYRRAVISKYIYWMDWFESLKNDRIHRAIRNTAKRLREEEDFEPEEAWKSAANKRKHLFDNLLMEYESPEI